MKVLILGDGILGTEIQKQTGWDLISRKKDGFDITYPFNFDWYLFGFYNHKTNFHSEKWDVIVNCIANTDTYSKDKQKHFDVNFKGVIDLVDYCNEKDIKLVHISTEYVYSNNKLPPSEKDIPIHGKNWYSYTKLLADGYVEAKSEDYLICRCLHKPMDFNHSYIWDVQTSGDKVDKIAKLIIKLINKDAKGIFNVGTGSKQLKEIQESYGALITPPPHVPKDTRMNINKMKSFLDEVQS